MIRVPKKCAQTQGARWSRNKVFRDECEPLRHTPGDLCRPRRRPPPEKLGCITVPPTRMVHIAAAAIEDDRLAIILRLLAADLRENRLRAVIVSLVQRSNVWLWPGRSLSVESQELLATFLVTLAFRVAI